MAKFGIHVPPHQVATTPDEAFKLAQGFNSFDLVIKAQVLAGGRGKGVFSNGFVGGVHLATTPEEVRELSSKMLGQRLVTKQTGPEGKPCDQVVITTRHYLRAEKYFAILLDRVSCGPMLMGSPKGGVDIEGVAHETPELIFKEPVDIKTGPSLAQLMRLAEKIGFRTEIREEAAQQMQRIYDMFIAVDATLIEVNPFAETARGEVMCLDAKVNFDDNASFRQKQIFAKKDWRQDDAREVQAAEHDLNFIGLDGNIGCLVNGAGLAMATMDVIKLCGGSPANFLDVGGGATEKQVSEAFKILAGDPKVRAILVNIFGGIMRCDVIAAGIVNAARVTNLTVPVVVRLQGTNVEEGRQILEGSGMKIFSANDLTEAATKAVKMGQILDMAREASLGITFELPL